MTLAQLQAKAERDAVLQDTLNQHFADELAQVLKLTAAKVRRLLKTLEAEDGRLVSTSVNLGRALQLRQGLSQALADAGYAALAAEAAGTNLDTLAASLLKGRGLIAQAGRFAELPIGDIIAALKDLRFADLLELGDDVAAHLWRTTIDGVLGVRPVADLVDDLGDLLEVGAGEARTIYDTAVSSFGRQIDQLGTSGEGDELFLYAGPMDSRTREFCAERVGKVFSRDEIDAMDNGQLPDVFLTCGGYACRHVLMPVSRLDDEAIGLHRSGERLPHVQALVDQVDEVAA